MRYFWAVLALVLAGVIGWALVDWRLEERAEQTENELKAKRDAAIEAEKYSAFKLNILGTEEDQAIVTSWERSYDRASKAEQDQIRAKAIEMLGRKDLPLSIRDRLQMIAAK